MMRKFQFLVLPVLALTGASVAQAQYYSQDALNPYGQAIYRYPQQQHAPRSYPYVGSQTTKPAVRKRSSKVDPALIEELRRRGKHQAKQIDVPEDDEPVTRKSGGKRIDKKIVVREKPVVRKHYRVVDDPPIVVRREFNEHMVQTGQSTYRAPVAEPPVGSIGHGSGHGGGGGYGGGGRVIHAEAEVTIIGPDRMSIRLYRKRDGYDAQAKAISKKKTKITTTTE